MFHAKLFDRAQFRAWLIAAPDAPPDQDRAEVRVYSGALTAVMLGWLALCVLMTGTMDETLTYKVAGLAWAGRWFVPCIFLAAFVLILPHFLALAFVPHKLAHELPRKMATAAAYASALDWLYMATLARPLDVGELSGLFFSFAVGSIVVGGVYAYSLNAQQLREKRANEPTEAIHS